MASGQATLSELHQEVRERANMENSDFVTDDELTRYLNKSIARLQNILVQKYGNEYFFRVPNYTFTADGTNQLFDLPSDMFKLLGVDILSGSKWVTLHPFTFEARNEASQSVLMQPSLRALRYRLAGTKLFFSRIPENGRQFRLWDVPLLARLSGDSDTVNGFNDAWLEFVIVDSAIKCLRKEESDTQELVLERAELKKEIEESAENRDAGSPATVSDVRPAMGRNWSGYDDDGGFTDGD